MSLTMNTEEYSLLFRKMLYERGIRTVGFDFSGEGDEGDVHSMFVPHDCHLPLSEQPHDSQADLSNTAAYDAFREITTALGRYENKIYEWLYDNCSYDWVNNEGGGGTLWVDVLTGESRIDGYYRELTNVPQIEHQKFGPPLELDTADHVKALLL